MITFSSFIFLSLYIRSAKPAVHTASLRYAHCVERCEGYRVDPCGPSAGMCALHPQQKGSPALMRIPVIGPNLHTWPQAPPLYIANERVEDTDGESKAEKES